MSVVWLFLDGVGLGENDPERNPWASVDGRSFIAVRGRPPTVPDTFFRPLDASLGVPGLPQSATGTTALLTGINAPEKLGRHLSGFPDKQLRQIISKHSIFLQAKRLGLRATFANAYNKAYFERPAGLQSVTTHCVRAAGLPFRMMDDYRAGRAVFHDLTGELIRRQGNSGRLTPPGAFDRRGLKKHGGKGDTFSELLSADDMPLITPEDGAERIARLTREFDLVLFEYVKTDMAGHLQQLSWARSIVDEVMRFLQRLWESLDPLFDTLLIASDHGNSEDLSTRSHTLNPVPAIAVGPLSHRILDGCEAITDLTPRVLEALKE